MKTPGEALPGEDNALLEAIDELEKTAALHAREEQQNADAEPALLRRIRRYPHSPDVKRIEELLATRASLMLARRTLLRQEAEALRVKCRLAVDDSRETAARDEASPRARRSVAVTVAHRISTLLVNELHGDAPPPASPAARPRSLSFSSESGVPIAPSSPPKWTSSPPKAHVAFPPSPPRTHRRSSSDRTPASPAKSPKSLALSETETKRRIKELMAKQAAIRRSFDAPASPSGDAPSSPSSPASLRLSESETKLRIATLMAKQAAIREKKAEVEAREARAPPIPTLAPGEARGRPRERAPRGRPEDRDAVWRAGRDSSGDTA